MGDKIQYSLIVINTIAAFIAAMVTLRSVILRGSRIWVNLYSFLVSSYVFFVYGLTAIGIISEDQLPILIRWVITAIMVMISLYYITDRRRGNNLWTRQQ